MKEIFPYLGITTIPGYEPAQTDTSDDGSTDTGYDEGGSYDESGVGSDEIYEGYTLDADGYYYGADGYYDQAGNFYEYD